MASIYNGLLYNDDVNMGVNDDEFSPAKLFTPAIDESTYTPIEPPDPSVPEVIDIDPSDTITRVIDGWTPDLTPTGGTPGEIYNDTPPTEKQENPAQRTKTIYSQTQIIISNYSATYLQSLEDQGFDFYVVYTDDSRDEVDISEIIDPHPSAEEISSTEAETIAKAINQYFWHDTNGVHVTDETQEDWFDAVADDFSDWPETPYHNILMNSLGLLLRTQLINLASLSRSGISFYDGEGNESSNILASFGLNGSLLRAGGRDVMRVTPNGVIFVPLEGNEVSVTMITDNIANLTNTVTSNKNELDLTIANMQAQIDGVVDTYYEEVDPEYEDELTDSNNANVVSSSNENIDLLIRTPWMYDWDTEEQKAGHEGDLYYNIETGHAWRWLKVDNVWQWYRIADSDVAQALQIARDANTLAGTKKRVFTATPTVPYDIGDLWVDGSQVKYATVAKALGSSYNANDWTQTATDDTLAQTALNKASDNETAINNLSGEVTVVKRDYVTNAAYEQNNLNWASSLTSLETSVKQYSDGLISTEVINRNSAITASANSINQTVAATYQVKGDYATNTALANEVAARNSAIETKAGQILTSVSETYVDNTTFGTFTTQTNNDITTIIGDQSTVKSVIYKHDAILGEITEETLGKIGAYYAANDPIINDDFITDSSGLEITSSTNSSINAFRYLSNSPVYGWTSDNIRSRHVGDLFINTTNSHIWRYTSNYIWEYIENTDAITAVDQSSAAITAARDATTTANGATTTANSAKTLAEKKRRVFTTQPTPPYDIGDLWIDGHTTKYSTYARSTGDFNLSDWRIASTDDYNLNEYKDSIATIIRETSSGVLVAKAASSIGSLQAPGYFDIVGINSWSGSTPTIGTTYARFSANGMSVYDNNGSSELAFIGIKNSKPYMQIGSLAKSNVQICADDSGYGYIDFICADEMITHFGYGTVQGYSALETGTYYQFGDQAEWMTDLDQYVGVWNSSDTDGCSFGRIVRYNNYYYVANTVDTYPTTTVPTNTANWSRIGAASVTSRIGKDSCTLGFNNLNAGPVGMIFGNNCINTGQHNFIIGKENHVLSDAAYTFTCGESNVIVSGTGNYCFGNVNYIKANNASVFGRGNRIISSYNSVAMGSALLIDSTFSHNNVVVIGSFNAPNSSDIFQIGNGNGNSSRSNAMRVTNGGYIYATSFQSSSDVRVKTDLGTLDTNESIKFIKSLKPHKYEKFGTTEIGFFAQDIENDPNYGDILVHQDTNYGYKDFRSLNYNGLIAPIVSALQNALDRIEQLENSK